MNKHQIAAIATALQRGAATAGRRLQVGGVGLAVAVLAAGCGSSTSTTTDRSATQSQAPTSPAGAHSGWTGIGAPVSAFESAHPPVTGQAGYGSGPTYPGPGQCCEFTELSTTRPPVNRVDGYTQALAIGTSVAAAKLEVLALMPSDTTTTAFFIRRDSFGHTCAMWNVQSPTLGKWFSASKTAALAGVPAGTAQAIGDPHGVMGIDLNTMNTQKVFSANNVTQAVISTTTTTHSMDC
jgi:hypothetical protein